MMARLLIVAAALVAVLAAAGVGAGAEWDVYQGAGTPIQDAIDGAEAGDTIYVHAGLYYENLNVDKRLTLIGDGADVVTVRAADTSDHVFEVTADWVNISGFKVTGATEYPYPTAGIYLNGVEYCNISDNIASDNSHGVYLNYSHNNALVNNNASNGHIGIHLYYSNGNSLTNNNATNHSGESIYLYSSNYNTLMENNVSNNYAGIILEYSSNDNVLTNNNVSNDYYGIMLWESSNNNKIYLNNFINNTDSVSPYESTNFWNSTEEITYIYNGNTYTNHLGNYWDGYSDVDAGNDGIWDHSYSINEEETDYHPLVKGFENYIEQSGFFIRPACQDEDGTHLDDANYEFIGHSGFSGTTDYNTYIDAPSQGSFQVRFWKDNLQATVTLESHSPKPFAGTVVTLRPGKVHNTDTGKDFSTIQEAIDDPATGYGHMIMVDPATYHENVNVYTSLTIKSTSGNPENTIVQAADSGEPVFNVTADYVNLTGFTVSGTFNYEKGGLHLFDARYCNISGNKVTGNEIGMYLYGGSHNKIGNNNASFNDDQWNHQNGIGIYLSKSDNNDITDNVVNSNTYKGILLYSSSYNKLIHNTASNNRETGIYLGKYLTIDPDSSSNIISNNICLQNGECGIQLLYSFYNQISNNICKDGFASIYMEHSSNNELANNTCENSQAGIRLDDDSDDNTIKNNNVSHNDEGFDFYVGSTGNRIYLNNFIDNSGYVAGEGNLFNSSEKRRYVYNGNIFENYTGNYWDGYTDVDTDNDGIWDHPYSIYHEEKDYYPLVEPFENYVEGEKDYSDLVEFTSNASIFYSGYIDYWFTPNWWYDLKADVDRQATYRAKLYENFNSPLKALEDCVTKNPMLAAVRSVARLFTTFMQFVDALVSFCTAETYGNAGLIVAQDPIFLQNIHRDLIDLIMNGDSIDRAISDKDMNRLENLLDARKTKLEELYSKLDDYDASIYDFTIDHAKDHKYSAGAWGWGYKHLKYFTIDLHLELQGDYIYTTYQLNRIRGNNGFEKLNEVVTDGYIRPTRYDTGPYYSYIIGCLDDVGDETKFVINLRPEEIEDRGLVISETKKRMTLHLEGPTSNDKWDGRTITIMDPTPGIYTLTVNATENPGMYHLVAYTKDFNPFHFESDTASVDIEPAGIDAQYPKPKLVDMQVDKNEISLDEGVILTIRVINDGNIANWQSIAVSSPDLINVGSYTILSHNLDYFEKYDIGDEVGCDYGNDTKHLTYALIEGAKNDWSNGCSGEVKLNIKPEKEGDLRVYVKSVAFGSGTWCCTPEIFETFTKDQQNEYVHVKRVIVTNREADETEVIIACPVNATITDQYGRIISDDGTNEMPDADMLITDDTKIFYLPADLTYSTEIDAYDTGTFNFTRVSPIGTDISITKFENISITTSTKAFVEIEPDVTNYTMSIDYDGDGVYETNITPNVNETIVITPTTTITKQITTSADDGYSSPSEHYDSTANLTMVGTFGEVDFNGWYRFQNITIPEGANIARAFVALTAYSDIYTEVPDDTLKTVIRAEYAANPLPPSSASDHAGRTRTPHSVEWDITEWEAGEIYSSPDISDIIQGLVNVHDYSSGAAIQIFHDATDDVPSVLYQPEAASGEGYITACTYDHSPLDAARLYIEYTVTSLRGDLNRDGTLTPTDAAIALRLAANGGWDAAADVNHDNHITSLDALMILQAAA